MVTVLKHGLTWTVMRAVTGHARELRKSDRVKQQQQQQQQYFIGIGAETADMGSAEKMLTAS